MGLGMLASDTFPYGVVNDCAFIISGLRRQIATYIHSLLQNEVYPLN
ncbi:hypothetical protein ALPO108162_05445 [Alicyclobacillus pomorum]|jgi:hypothetical protein